MIAMLRLQGFPFTKGKRALRGRGRGSESPPLHPLKNPHNPPERLLSRRRAVRLYLSPSARCAECGALSPNLCFAFPIGIALSEMLRLKIKSEIRRRLYAAVSLGRSRVNSSVPNSQAKHKSFDRPAASAQRGSVIPFPGMK